MKPYSPPRKPALKTSVGPNWKLIRNLFIIAVLLAAISYVWDHRQKVLAERELEKRRNIERMAEARRIIVRSETDRASATPPDTAKDNEKNMANSRETSPTQRETNDTDVAVQTPSRLPEDNVETSPQKKKPQPPPEIVNLNTKAGELINNAVTKRTNDLALNAKTLAWNLDAHLRTLPKSEQERWAPFVNEVKASIREDRVPDARNTIGSDDRSKSWFNIVRAAAAKQSEIDNGFLSEARKIHGAYIRRIEEASKQADSAGQAPLAALLKEMLEEAREFRGWLSSVASDEISHLSNP